MDAELAELSRALEAATAPRGAGQSRLTIATAESCTGGWLAEVITHTAGSSAWFDRGVVTYSNTAKTELLGVAPERIARHGAVSLEVATDMTHGLLLKSTAILTASITGIAGPGGGSPDKPVGTVCFAWCVRGQEPNAERRQFAGDREAVRRQAVVHALRGLLAQANSVP